MCAFDVMSESTIRSAAEFKVRAWATAGIGLGLYAAAVALAPDWRWACAAVAPLVLVPLSWWSLAEPGRWFAGFCAASLLLPRLPIAIGNSSPHAAILFGGLGLWCGLARLSEWRFRVERLSVAMLLFPSVLLVSIPFAAVYSGAEVAAGSLVRVGLFGVAIFTFFFFADGPGARSRMGGWIGIKGFYFAAVASALFACVDFYYQFPPLAGFAEQFVWLETGIYRRAQGVFLDAGMLGNVCAFLLVMVVLAWLRPEAGRHIASRKALFAGGTILSAALLFSFSRSSMLNLVVALIAVLYLDRSRVRLLDLIGLAAACLLSFAGLTFFLAPDFARQYAVRAWYTLTEFEVMLGGRLETWQAILEFLAANPWHAIFGVGFKTLPHSTLVGENLIPDNMYLSTLVETGLAGLATMLFLSGAILAAGYQAAQQDRPEASFCGAWIFCFWCGQLFQMASVDVLTYWRVLPIYLFVLALAVRSPSEPRPAESSGPAAHPRG